MNDFWVTYFDTPIPESRYLDAYVLKRHRWTVLCFGSAFKGFPVTEF